MDKMRNMEHRVKMSPAQVRKLVSGGAITLKPANFDPSSRMSISVMPNTSRRIGTAMRKNRGVRLMLKPTEDILEEGIEGGKISLKSVGRQLKKTLGSKKAREVYRQIGKEVAPIAKGAIDTGIDVGSQALAAYLGNPALAPAIAGTAKMGVDAGYSALGKEIGYDPNAPVPTISNPEELRQALIDKAEDNIKRRTKGQLRDASLELLKSSTAPREEMVGDGLRVRKTRGGIKIGGMNCCMGGYGVHMSGGSVLGMATGLRGVSPAVAPSSITQLGSPYQSINSPAMSPFIAASPQLANKAISGGSFIPAGRRGNGFNPAG